MPIRLVLADEHPLIRYGLTQLFAGEPDFLVAACCRDGEQALQAVRQQRPDILALNLRLPGLDGLSVLHALRPEQPGLRVVLLSAELDDPGVREAIRLGVQGVAPMATAPEMLLQRLRQIQAGGQWLEPARAGRAPAAPGLTCREQALTRLVAQGLSNHDIARQLFITEGTVKVHLHRIYEKLGVNNRVNLTRHAQRMGLV
jgi:DNA-binding NarL/FixJ family response regulator